MSKRAGAVFAFLILLSALVVGVTNAFAATPTLTVDPASTASYASAEVSGTVDPADNEVFYWFQYSKEPATEGWENGPEPYAHTLPANSGPTSVSERLTSLKPSTEYRVRLLAISVSDGTEWTSEAPYVTFETKPVGAPTMTIDPATLSGGGVQLSGSIDPNAPEAAPTSTSVEEGFKVEWHFECTPECPGLSGGTVAADNTTPAHAVKATSTELQPNTHYEATLIGVNAAGPTTVGPISFTTGAVAPHAETVPAFAFGGGARASLAGRVDAKNSPTEYWFEYGASAAYGQTVPAVAGSAGSGRETFVTQDITGLVPSTVYHYRLVAVSPAGRDNGEDKTFETTPASTAVQQNCPNTTLRAENGSEALPACRAYEMVSPSNKNGNDIGGGPESPWETAARSSSDPGISYESAGALSGSATNNTRNYYLGHRGTSGWTYNPISPPEYTTSSPGTYPQYRRFLPDLDYGFLNTITGPSLAAGDIPGVRNLYVRNNVTNTYQTLNIGGPAERAMVVGSSADAAHVAFETSSALTPDAPIEGEKVYEWSGGQVRLASILPDGSPAPYAAGGGAEGARSLLQSTKNIVSEDGSKVFFGVRDSEFYKSIYVRIDGQRTVKVSATQNGEPGAEEADSTEFEGATADGSAVFFLANRPLTDAAAVGTSLYRFDVDSETLTDLSVPESNSGQIVNVETIGGQSGVLGTSEDGSYAYFYAYGRLLNGGPSSGIYVWHAGHLSLVAADSDPGTGYAYLTTSRVTPSGRNAVFMTTDRVTAYDNQGANEVYLVDGSTGRVVCVSCVPDGAPPARGGSALIKPPIDAVQNPQRSVSDKGNRVFFTSEEALVSGDVNHRLDVYAWEEGEIHLISSGTSDSPSYFADASESGEDAYFITREPLVSTDHDENSDVYDARIGGGFPRAIEPPRCVGEGCQGQQGAPPSPPAAGSEAVVASGGSKSSGAQRKLQKAIKTCKRKHRGKARKKCVAGAHKRFGKNSNGRSK